MMMEGTNMRYIKLFENKYIDYLLLYPSGEVLDLDSNIIDMFFYDSDTYDFDLYEIEWDDILKMYKSKDIYRDEIIKRIDIYKTQVK